MLDDLKSWQRKGIYILLVIALIILIFLGVISFVAPFLVKENCKMEAGKPLTTEKVIQNPVVRLFSSVYKQPVIDQPGISEAVIRVGVQKVTTQVNVLDRVAPKVEVRDVSVIQGNQCKVEEFIVSISDATETKVEYVKQPRFNDEGIQKVQIRVTDLAGNITEVTAQLIIVGK